MSLPYSPRKLRSARGIEHGTHGSILEMPKGKKPENAMVPPLWQKQKGAPSFVRQPVQIRTGRKSARNGQPLLSSRTKEYFRQTFAQLDLVLYDAFILFYCTIDGGREMDQG